MQDSVKTVSFKYITILVLLPSLKLKIGFAQYDFLLNKIKHYVTKHNFSFGNFHILLWSFFFQSSQLYV